MKDRKIMDAASLHRMSAAGADVDVQRLHQQCVFGMTAADSDGKPHKVLFSEEVLIYRELYIHHGSALNFQNVSSLVKEHRINKPLLRNLVLNGLGLTT